ncbi:hypothetical protein [Rhodoplanes sp. Z2-YC6860]|nr:hypothetical protein [Rhodoplanes sp. Z2-YC6860]
MRDFIIITVLCLVAAIVADRMWLDGRYAGKITRQWGLDMSPSNRR